MKTLVVISGSATYFYNQSGRRLAEALRELGCSVHLRTLRTFTEEPYDWCFLMNTTDLVASMPDKDAAMTILARIRQCSRHLALVLLESVTTNWFVEAYGLGVEAGIDLFIDMGLHDQREKLEEHVQPIYRFAFNGLTASERLTVENLPKEQNRPIPWVMIGHHTPARAKLAYRLVTEFDPAGFVYLCRLDCVTENGPHINEQQFLQVLGVARYQVWCTHHPGFYLEGERIRSSLLAGGVPLKILIEEQQSEVTLPFSYLMVDEENFIAQIKSMNFTETRNRFTEEFFQFPTLAESMGELFG